MDKLKHFFIALWGGVMSMLGILAIPVILLVVCNIIDYATGLLAAPNRNQVISSYKGFRGIAKKVCMWLLVVVGVIIDQVLKYAATTIGITLPFTFLIACIVAIWLIANELLSILENISETGVQLPGFLKNIVIYIKKQAEAKAIIKGEDEDIE